MTLPTTTKDAERFIEEIRSDDRELALPLRIEERELEAGERSSGACDLEEDSIARQAEVLVGFDRRPRLGERGRHHDRHVRERSSTPVSTVGDLAHFAFGDS